MHEIFGGSDNLTTDSIAGGSGDQINNDIPVSNNLQEAVGSGELSEGAKTFVEDFISDGNKPFSAQDLFADEISQAMGTGSMESSQPEMTRDQGLDSSGFDAQEFVNDFLSESGHDKSMHDMMGSSAGSSQTFEQDVTMQGIFGGSDNLTDRKSVV